MILHNTAKGSVLAFAVLAVADHMETVGEVVAAKGATAAAVLGVKEADGAKQLRYIDRD